MGIDAKDIIGGLARGVDSGVKNLMMIQKARYDMQQDKERDKVERSYKEALMKKTELELGDMELEAQQRKAMHENALERMKGAVATIGAISGLNNQSGFAMPSMSAGMPGARPQSLEVGQSEGGQVLTPRGSTLDNGQILGPAGNRIGEYAEGYEPQQAQITPERASMIAGMSEGGLEIPKQEQQQNQSSYIESIREQIPEGQSMKIGGQTVKGMTKFEKLLKSENPQAAVEQAYPGYEIGYNARGEPSLTRKRKAKQSDEEDLFGNASAEASDTSSLNTEQQDALDYYKEKYPGRTDEELLAAMKEQGLL